MPDRFRAAPSPAAYPFRTQKMKTPKFAEGQKVTLSYSDWDGDAYPVDATVRKSEFFERPEGGRPGFHYMLEIADPSKLDKTDRCALE